MTYNSATQNQLLRCFAPDDFAELHQHMRLVTLPLGQVMTYANADTRSMLFPETCVMSMIASTASGREAEVGLIGFEGTTGIVDILGDTHSPLEAVVQAAGTALQLPVRALESVRASNPGINAVLLRYVHSFIMQISSSALAFASFTVSERLARWLLMMQDRSRVADLFITHETLATMLGVRRAGVTLALQDVARRGLIRKRRGVITVVDRSGLEKLAGDSYGAAEAELQRSLGIDIRYHPS